MTMASRKSSKSASPVSPSARASTCRLAWSIVNRMGMAGRSDLRLSRQPRARFVLVQEHLGRALRRGEIDESPGEVRRFLVGCEDGHCAARLEVAGIGAHAGAQHHHIVVEVDVLGYGEASVEQLAVGQGALHHDGVEEVL